MHSRWSREMQRRCGSKALWECVSFTGKWDPTFLALVNASQRNEKSGKLEGDEDAQSKLKFAAVRARGEFRWANHLLRKRSRSRKNWLEN